MKAAIYARVSTKDGRQDVESQLRQLREFAHSQQWTVVHEYIDHASGKRSDREQLGQMLTGASRSAPLQVYRGPENRGASVDGPRQKRTTNW